MSESTEPNSEPEIKADAEWKHRVKAEAAELDAKRKMEHAEEEAPASPPPTHGVSASQIDASQLPPANFDMLVTMFSTQAMVALGVLPSPLDGKAERNLALARHFIDLLGVLQEKTRRNLTGHEANFLEQSLHELRMAFVELSKSDTLAAS